MTQGPNALTDAQLRQLLNDLQSVTEVDVTFGGLIDSGSSSFTITRMNGARTKELRNLIIRSGLGLGGQAMSRRCPVWVRDYPVARGITHEYDPAVRAEQLRAIFAIPLTIAKEVRAVVYGALRLDVPLGDRTLKAAELALRQSMRGFAEIDGTAREAVQPARHTEQDCRAAIQSLRTAHDELATIAAGLTDDALRNMLNDICCRMRAPLNGNVTKPAVKLSPREIAVLAQVAEGRKNSEIAERLSIVPGTVKAYLESAMRKFGTHNRIMTVNAARQAGLLP